MLCVVVPWVLEPLLTAIREAGNSWAQEMGLAALRGEWSTATRVLRAHAAHESKRWVNVPDSKKLCNFWKTGSVPRNFLNCLFGTGFCVGRSIWAGEPASQKMRNRLKRRRQRAIPKRTRPPTRHQLRVLTQTKWSVFMPLTACSPSKHIL